MRRRFLGRCGALSWLVVAMLGWAPPGRAAGSDVRSEGEPDRPIVTRWSRPRPVDLADASRARSAGAAETSESSFLSLEDPPDGDMPLDLAFTASGSEVAIVNRDSSNVTFLDTATGTINRSVDVGQFPVDLAVTPDGRYLLTADLGDDTVSVLDLATHKVKATVPVTGKQPFQIEVTADSRFAVVGLINNGIASAFSVIDLQTLHEVRTIPSAPQGVVGGWFSPFSGAGADVFTRFALTPDGLRIVLAETYEDRVVVYDRQTGTQLASIPTKKAPADIDISSDGAFAIISHEVFPEPGEVTRIDLQGLRVDRLYSTPFPPHSQHVRITPDRRTVLVTGYDDDGGLTAFIDLQTGAVTATVPSGIAEQIVLTADGRSAFLASTIPGYVLDLATQSLASYLPPPEAALYRAAASPTGRRVAAIDSQFGESVYLYDLSGPEAILLATALTGEAPESDAPVSLALTPDGTTAVVGHRVSANMAIVDVVAGAVRGYTDTGRDTRDVATAVASNGAWGLAASYEEDTLTIADLATGQRLASLPVPDGPDRILVAPDGRTAYVFTIRGQDRVYFVALNGAQSHIVASLPTANRFGIGFGTTSTGVALSGDGRVLAVCGGSPNGLQLIDTVTRQQIAQVPLGALPRRVVLSHDHTKAWVSALETGVSVIRIGSGSASLQTVIPVTQPFDLHLDATGAFVYAVSASTSQRAVYVIDAASDALVATVGIATATNFSLGASDLAPGPNLLYVAGVSTQNPPHAVVTRLEAAGANTRIRDDVPVSGDPSELEVTNNGQRAVLTQTSLDGLDLALFDAAAGTCTPAPDRLCLNQSRFQIDVTWRTPQGLTGTGQSRPLTDDAGAFWFFSAANLEMMVKVLNGCATNNRYWVFAAGLTNVEVTLKVTDRKTGTVRTYTNPLGTAFKPLQDTAAFATCP